MVPLPFKPVRESGPLKGSVNMRSLAIAIATVVACGAFAQTSMRTHSTMRVSHATVSNIIANWKAGPKKAANMMITKYGEPNEATETHLVWWNNGPWKYTIIDNVEFPHNFPMPHKDLMRQVIDYKVPPGRLDELANYDGSVIFDRTPGEISARCDKEEANFLAINLANDVVMGKRTVNGARDFYAKTVMALMKMRLNNEQRRYTSGFVFKVPRGNTSFVDRPHGKG
jgi:hypothetical protein